MRGGERESFLEREREKERERVQGRRERELSTKKIRGFICLLLQQYSILIPSIVALYKILSNLRWPVWNINIMSFVNSIMYCS